MVIPNPLRSIHLSRPTDLSHHHDTLCIRVIFKNIQSIDEIRPRQHVTAHTNAETLSQTGARDGCHSFVTQSPRLGHNSYITGGKAGQWLETDPAFANG